MVHTTAERAQQRLGLPDVGVRAADQRDDVLVHDRTARSADGRVDEAEARFGQLVGQGPGLLGQGGRGVDDHLTGVRSVPHAVVPEQHVAHVFVLRQRRHDPVDAPRRLRGGVGRRASPARELRDPGTVDVVTAHDVAGIEQVAREPAAHRADADEGDGATTGVGTDLPRGHSNLTRGSTNVYAMSTMKLTMMNMKAMNKMAAIATG